MKPNFMLSTLVFGAALAGLLTLLATIDIRARILPNELNISLGLMGLLQTLVVGRPSFLDAALGSVVCGGLLIGIATLFQHLRGKEGLGMGDQKFGLAAGFWIGWQSVPLMLLISATTALIFIGARSALTGQFDRSATIPFGPFLAGGAFVTWLVNTCQP